MTTSSANAPALLTNPQVATLAQRQDSVVDQLFDVMALANAYGYRAVAAYIYVFGLGGKLSLSERDQPALVVEQLPHVQALALVSGSGDAAQWLARHQSYLK